MFNFGVFHMFRTQGFISTKTAVYTVMVLYILHESVYVVWWVEECVQE